MSTPYCRQILRQKLSSVECFCFFFSTDEESESDYKTEENETFEAIAIFLKNSFLFISFACRADACVFCVFVSTPPNNLGKRLSKSTATLFTCAYAMFSYTSASARKGQILDPCACACAYACVEAVITVK